MTYRLDKAVEQVVNPPKYTQEMAGIAWEAMPENERETLLNAIQLIKLGHVSLARKVLDDYAVVRYRNSIKARRDAIRDRRERTLIGARIPREDAKEVKEAAQGSGRSVYRFVCDAVEREVARCQE